MRTEIEAAIPERGFLKNYVEFATAGTMAPPEFHLACGLAMMATLLSNRVVFELGRHPYPAAVWLVLLGKAGTKKSSAINLATRLLDMATDSRFRLPQEATREALLTLLGGRPAGYIPLSEFLGFLERSKRDYMGGIREDLCEIFDHPAKMERRLQSGSTFVSRPAVTIMGGAVTDSLAEWVRRRDLAGGFLSRFLFIPQVSPVNYIGLDSKGPDPREDDLIAGLRHADRLVPAPPAIPVVDSYRVVGVVGVHLRARSRRDSRHSLQRGGEILPAPCSSIATSTPSALCHSSVPAQSPSHSPSTGTRYT